MTKSLPSKMAAVTKKKYVGSVKEKVAPLSTVARSLLQTHLHARRGTQNHSWTRMGPTRFHDLPTVPCGPLSERSQCSRSVHHARCHGTSQQAMLMPRKKPFDTVKQLMDKIAGTQASNDIKTDRLKQDHVHNAKLALETFNKRANFGSSQSIQTSRRQVQLALSEHNSRHMKNSMNVEIHCLEWKCTY
jgi:hypothetical protein